MESRAQVERERTYWRERAFRAEARAGRLAATVADLTAQQDKARRAAQIAAALLGG